MKSSQRYTQHSIRGSQLPGRRSAAGSLLESLNETLSQTGLSPHLTQPATGGKARLRRGAGTVAMILGLAAVGFLMLRSGSDLSPVAGDPVATLEIVHGSVGVLPASAGAGSSLLTLAAGQPVHAGTVIETASIRAGAPGRAAVRLAGGQSMRLDGDTRVRVDSRSQLVLERGAVYVDSEARGNVEVRTTLGMVRDVGTQFEVRLLETDGGSESLRVRVREGSIVLERDGESHHATHGEELAVGGDGTLHRGTAPIHGPEWDWVLETAPAPDVADQPLETFLDWVGREGGWDVRYADEATARLASTTILHGDVRGLTLTEASSMVLGSSGLAYRVVGGTFVVEPKPQEIARR